MSEINLGLLLKRKNVRYEGKEIEIYEVIDFVPAISFLNNNNINVYNILSGEYIGQYVYLSEKNNKYFEFTDCVFFPVDLEKVIEINDNKVDYINIRKLILKRVGRFQFKKAITGTFVEVTDKKLLKFLGNNEKVKAEFREEDLGKDSDIVHKLKKNY